MSNTINLSPQLVKILEEFESKPISIYQGAYGSCAASAGTHYPYRARRNRG